MTSLISRGETPTRLCGKHRPDQRPRGPVQADSCRDSRRYRLRPVTQMASAIAKTSKRTAPLRLFRTGGPIPLLLLGFDAYTRYNLVNPPVARFVRHGRYRWFGIELPAGTTTGAPRRNRRIDEFLK